MDNQTLKIFRPRIDIFCRVVDNLGDAGVTWRLARQLAQEKDCAVRLIIDNLAILSRFATGLDCSKMQQSIGGITVLGWDEDTLPSLYAEAGDCIIEAFACTLPDFIIGLMQKAAPVPVWIDLEYLSAEAWIESCHAVPSPHPTSGLIKTLFFPGFTDKTGGLIREEKLLQERNDFQSSILLQNQWRQRNNLPEIASNILDISVFSYKNAPFENLTQRGQGHKLRLFTTAEIAAQIPQQIAESCELHVFAFLPQPDYDRLLWTCGVNFVRGEDSFVRAFWAGRPFIWQIYEQERAAHFVKLEAFLAYYCENLERHEAEALANFTRMWNLGAYKAEDLPGFFDALPALSGHARKKAVSQAQQDDLATQLLRFIALQQGIK